MTDLFDQGDDRDYLAELTGPGKKFDKSKYANEAEMWKAIAKGKVHADVALELKNTEMDEMRAYTEELRKAATTGSKVEDLLQRLENQQTIVPKPDTQRQETQPSLDPAKLAELVQMQVQEIEQRKIESQNMTTVEQKLRERFGENAASVLKEKMKSLNLSNDDLKMLAKKSPDAVLNALGVNSFQRPSDLPRSSMRTDNFAPDVEIRDAVYYEKLRKEKPKEYFSEKTSVQRLKDMENPDFLKRYNERLSARAFQ